MAALATPLTPRIGALINPVVGVARAPQIGGVEAPPHLHPKTAGRAEDWGAIWGDRLGCWLGASWTPRTAWGEGSVEQVRRSRLGGVPTPVDGLLLGAYVGGDVSRGADRRRGSACPLGASFTSRRGEGDSVLRLGCLDGLRRETTPLLHLAGHHVEPERPATSALSGNAGVAGVSGRR